MLSKNKFQENDTMNLGNITVSKEVVAIIAALEAIKVKGVVGISSGHKAGSTEILPRKELTKGIEVWMKPDETNITIPIVTKYEVGVYKVAQEVQEKTIQAVKTMTGLKTIKVNINIQGVKFKEEKIEKQEKEKEEKVEKTEKKDKKANEIVKKNKKE
ncbi:MAG: hypothetical protein Kow00103_10330 [Candidatus Caldatribacteriota bacterium]